QKRGFNIWDVTLKLHQRTKSPLIKWRLSYTVLCFYHHWRIPIRNSYDKILDLIKACVLNGDQIFTSYSVALYLRSKMNAGENLEEILANSDDHIAISKNLKGGFDFFECFYQMAKALNGQTYQDSWDDDSFNGTETQRRLEKEGNRTKLGFFHSAKCNYLYLNEDYIKALKESEVVLSYADNFLGDQQEVSLAFYRSLSIAACYESLSNDDKTKYLKAFKGHLKDLKLWAEGCPENYSQHYHLMRAEFFSLQDKFEDALKAYEKAIQLAAENRFTHIEAIAYERAAEFCSNTGLEKQSRFYIERAWFAYHNWGAHAKCKKLEKRFPQFLYDKTKQKGLTKTGESTTSTSSTSELDLASVLKASQSISSQVKYEDLLNNLMHITIENAGAERGCLVLERDNQLCIEAIGVSGSDIIEIYPSIPLSDMKIVPESILNYCWRTEESVVLDDARTDERFNSDPYFGENQTLSVMCLPITALGQSIGLLYLENSLIEGVFNKNRIKLLQMLSGQIGISIENANLYSNLEEKVKERTREIEKAYENLEVAHENLKSAQEQLVQQEKLASLGQLTAGIAHEIKNPLNFVNNFSELSVELVDEAREEVRRETANVKRKADEGEEQSFILEILDDIEANLRKINEHGTRADSIVKSMLQHSRGGSGSMEPTNLNSLIKEFVNLSFHGMKAKDDAINVDIELDLDDSIGEIDLIAEDFSRVILNLCNNAFDAMRDKLSALSSQQSEKSPFEGGMGDDSLNEYEPKLTIRTQRNDQNITIEIQDNGPGIPDELKEKVFQPFFTTKKGTAGTGLGLSITNDIVKAHGGRLEVDSTRGEGVVFTIHLQKPA
ncbi:MAG: ATP-binding protein, partial [Balneolaceae bacterium]|nr:ATP-binding protein [Balneolaceae bacterium]